ncbi:TonB-dependent receptor [uncultured Paludibaculum sp.]|uniref:TonB-dependent receptor n=1 Tax=uncultured Paludibaculum sp. TaxID=1765020 RepID=UPI002AAB4464|nr:TonB-dependent receptor [uncultured Paludibaculum sp.]
MSHKAKLLTICFFCLAATFGFSQSGSTLSGTVRDPQQAGIPAARVTLTSRDNTTRLTVTSDGQGAYRFDRLLPGEYLLEAHARGFVDSTAQVARIEKDGRATIDLALQVAGLQTQVVVTASGTPQTADELSKALSVVDAQTIDARDEFSITDALRSVPGLRIQRLGGPGAFTTIKTRGLRNEDTAVLVDGFRLRDAAATQGDASALLEDLIVTNVDRVEVLRGAGSSLYGTNAAGGVINVITGEGGGRTRGSLLLEGGALDMFRSRAAVTGSLKHDKLQYSLGAAHLNVMSGVNGDTPARTSSLQGRIDYAFSPKVRLFGRIFAADSFSKLMNSPQGAGAMPASGIVDAVPLPDAELRRYEAGTPIAQLNLGGATFIPSAGNSDYTRAGRVFSGALRLSLHPVESLGLTASYQGLRTRRRFGDGPAGVDYQPAGSTLSFYDGEIHTAGTRMDWRLGRHQSVNAGYEFESENYGNRSLLPSPVDNSAVAVTQRSNTLFVQDQLQFLDGRLQLSGSYRAQIFSLNRPVFTPLSSAPYSGVTFAAPPAAQTGDGSAAYFFRGTGTKLRAHAGKGYRAPSLYERFGTYYGSYGYSAYGDPRLRPDRSIAVDGGVDQALWNNRARLSATYFYTRLQEVIVYDSSGAIKPTVDPYGRYGGYRNTNGGLARGVELSASIAPTRSLNLTTAYTYTNARQRTPLVPGVLRTYVIPDHQFSVAATQRLSSRLTVVFDLLASSDYLAPIYDPITYASRAFRFPGIARAQAGANYRLPLGEFLALRFFAKVDNLFNQTDFESGFRTPGANAQGGIQFEF